MSRDKQKRSKNKVVTKHPMGGVVVPPIIQPKKSRRTPEKSRRKRLKRVPGVSPANAGVIMPIMWQIQPPNNHAAALATKLSQNVLNSSASLPPIQGPEAPVPPFNQPFWDKG